ncbi:MAG: response regulator transcription factor [Clostridiaceae bacterium]
MSLGKILIVEDENKIARFTQLELEHEGYSTFIETDGRSALTRFENEIFDLVLLDVMLPSLNGMEVLRRLRQISNTPVIMLTAKDDVTDKVMGLDLGADDYMTKPFAIEELLARIRVALKKRLIVKENTNILKIKKLSLDLNKHTVYYMDNEIEVTNKEYNLLKYLIENKNIVLTRDKILAKVWDFNYIGDTNVVDVYIRYLRSKIDDKFKIKLIYTVRGVGYLLKED